MPKLIFKIQPRTFLIVVFACLLILLGGRILLATGIIIPFALLVSIVGGVYVYRKKKFEKRVDLLRNKYRDDNLVQRIMKRNYWIGQSAEQLIDSLGMPVDRDIKALKTMSREVWKYDQRGVNRFGLRITLDNGIVVGFDHKA